MKPFQLLSEPDQTAVMTRAAELAQVNESLQRRERLLAAAARASRLLLEAPNAMIAMPDVLKLLGEAASVDRTVLALAQIGPTGERWLVTASEWTSAGGGKQNCLSVKTVREDSECACEDLRAGRPVCFTRDGHSLVGAIGIASEEAKSAVIVPIHVDGEYAGVIGFDDCRHPRHFDPAVVSALEIAAGVIGAALHRERLIEAVRIERERAADQRLNELARANAVIRSNLERLATEPDLYTFKGHVLLETVRQLDAAAGTIIVLKDALNEWRVIANVRDGQIEDPPFPPAIKLDQAPFTNALLNAREPRYIDLESEPNLLWPGSLEYHQREGHVSIFILPLVFGNRTVGCISLSFRRRDAIQQHRELLVALGQQATLAIELTRLAHIVRDSAVLVERNRIGQEIHDGLAQAFTGILMQLGATEELKVGQCQSLTLILDRIRDLAREGLSEARRSVMALRIDQARRAGLELALRQLCERSTVSGRVSCQFEGGGVHHGLRPEHEHELLRIAQEALSNAMRHGQPKTVRIAMNDDSTHWTMSIADDGIGMQEKPELYAQRGFGLTSMRERASAIGGEWRIESGPGAGTRISVRLPKRKTS